MGQRGKAVRSGLRRRLRAAAALLAALLPMAASAEAPSQRVVSMNVCTDQLAMLVAAPGQLVSVSVLARDPRYSAMAEAAAGYPTNIGRAEGVFLMEPDLILASAFTDPTSIAMLRRLGLRVEVFEPVTDLAEIPGRLRRMGALLGQQARAEAEARAFEEALAGLAAAPRTGLRAGLYQANGYTTGSRTLAGQIVAAAGLSNIADDEGLAWGGFLPLERLVMAAPDLLISSRPGAATSRADAILEHPALRTLDAPRSAVSGSDWACGTPHVLGAVARLREAVE